MAGQEMCRTNSSELFPYALGEGGSGGSYGHIWDGEEQQNNMKKNQHHCLSLKREKLDLMITGHLFLILGAEGN